MMRGAFGAWVLKKRRQETPIFDPDKARRSDQAGTRRLRTQARVNRAGTRMEAYVADPSMDFSTFMDAVRQIEQDALEDMRQLRRIIRRDEKR
jgi:hypothetical protein